MGVKLQSALGGSVELNAPSTASNFSMTVPATSGSVATTDQLSMFRNRLINGDMRINQRAASGTITIPTNNTAYALDRWMHYSGAGTSNISRISSGITDFPFALQAQPQTGCTQLNCEQRIESSNVSDLIGVPCTLSGKIYIDNATGVTFRPYWYYPSAVDNWASVTFNQLSAIGLTGGTYISFSVTFTPDTNIVRGLGVVLEFTGSIAGKTIRITGVQLEKGTVATPFERRPFGVELALCQRYYEKSFSLEVAPQNAATSAALAVIEGSVTGAAQNRLNAGPAVFFKQTKRAVPTISKYGNNASDWIYGLQTSGSWVGSANSGMARVSDSSFVADQQIVDNTTVIIGGHWVANAEL